MTIRLYGLTLWCMLLLYGAALGNVDYIETNSAVIENETAVIKNLMSTSVAVNNDNVADTDNAIDIGNGNGSDSGSANANDDRTVTNAICHPGKLAASCRSGNEFDATYMLPSTFSQNWYEPKYNNKINDNTAWNDIRAIAFNLVNASVGVLYTRYSSIAGNTTIFIFDNPFNITDISNADDELTALRVEMDIEELGAKNLVPMMFVVKQKMSVQSWKLPITFPKSRPYFHTNRTLCTCRTNVSAQTRIIVEVSTLSSQPIQFNFSTRLVNVKLPSNGLQSIKVTPSAPTFFVYTFSNNTNSLTVKVTSNDSTCLIFSIQSINCPVYYLTSNQHISQGMYQTVTKKGAITVQRNFIDGDSFRIVFAILPTDDECENVNRPMHSGPYRDNGLFRKKVVNVEISAIISDGRLYVAMFAAFGAILFIYLVSFLISVVYHVTVKDQHQSSLLETEVHEPLQNAESPSTRSYGSMRQNTAADAGRSIEDAELTSQYDDDDDDESELDLLPDIDEEKDVFRTKTFLYICDLAKKPRNAMAKKYKLYHWNLIPISIFYGLPVVQLVLTYQTVLHVTGNEDICYYNFLCAHPLGPLNAFNNIFSNVGYVCLGILFLMLTYRRDVLHCKLTRENPRLTKYFGIPQHFGLFYAMGAALVMEGILSSCYHVCPNFSNFQFDTSFMYVIAVLLMLRIYQTRHPDISAHAHTTYVVVAVIIFISVIGVVYSSLTFWIVFCVAHLLCSILLSTQIYYMGRWKLNLGILKRIYLLVKMDGRNCVRPVYLDRMCLLLFANLVNWGMAGYGLWKQPMNFASYLLSILVLNLLLYFAFYIIMKIRSGEKILPVPIAYIFIATLVWVLAFYFFGSGLTSWQVSPAKSREGNQKCALLGFYDYHDIWHFLSSTSVFFSFMAMLTLDDDLIYVPREKIPVF